MSMTSHHRLKLPLRSIIATTMMVLYLFISLSPLLSPALRSKTVLHALTGECSGDCNICGCSPESRAKQTCCCSKKKHLEARGRIDGSLPECCKKTPGQKEVVIASCGCPCGSGKDQVPATGKAGEILPFYFSACLATPPQETLHPQPPPPLISRVAEPPDPPPRQA
jgi:hypothetical protein